MCLGIPMQVITRDDLSACCEARGERRNVSLLMMFGMPLSPGDWVLVSAGNAARRISQDEARATWALLDEMADPKAAPDA